jgi:hypothetical protein
VTSLGHSKMNKRNCTLYAKPLKQKPLGLIGWFMAFIFGWTDSPSTYPKEDIDDHVPNQQPDKRN